MNGIVIFGGIVVIILLVVGMVATSSREQGALEERLSQYLGEQAAPGEAADQRRNLRLGQQACRTHDVRQPHQPEPGPRRLEIQGR